MKKYKIGYYYQNRLMRDEYHHNNRLVASFVGNHLEFKLINGDLWPHFYERFEYSRYIDDFFRKYRYIRRFNPYNYRDNCLDYPVIFTEDNDGLVQELFFLSDVPTVKKNQIIDGFSISEPGDVINSTSLYYNGEEVFPSDNYETSNELLFYKTVIHQYAVERKVEFLQKESKPACEYFLQDDVKRIKEYLDSINLEDILSDIKVSVNEWHHVKLGDDDSYGIYRTITVSNPLAKDDDYLRRVIKPGREDIYSVHAFTPWGTLRLEASDFLEQHPLGEYTGELLENEKRRIISSYSKEDHLIHLLIKRFVDRDKNRLETPIWEKRLQEIIDVLTNKFHYKELLKINSSKCRTSLYGFSNSHDMNKEMSSINNYIKQFTLCE
jgi:hypothetical protein